MQGTLFQGIVFIVFVAVVCAIQGVRYSVKKAGHRLLVKSKHSVRGL